MTAVYHCGTCGGIHDEISLAEKSACIFYWVDRARERALRINALETSLESIRSITDTPDELSAKTAHLMAIKALGVGCSCGCGYEKESVEQAMSREFQEHLAKLPPETK